jgi:hypothetical protein
VKHSEIIHAYLKLSISFVMFDCDEIYCGMKLNWISIDSCVCVYLSVNINSRKFYYAYNVKKKACFKVEAVL